MKGEIGFSQHKPFILCPHSDNGSSSQRRSSCYRENLFITEETATAMEGEAGLPNFGPSAMYAYNKKARLVSTD